jgi:hypothetical protein
MMRSIHLLVSALALAGFAGNTAAVSGNDLYAACQSPGQYEQGFCAGFIQAAKHSIAAFPAMSQDCKRQLTLASPPQLTEVVLEELRDNPDSAHYSAFSLAFMALAHGFDCLPEPSH